ncbi:TPA: hypothetical protein NKQ43_005221 [Vibrio parahaemolyticus]|uniref:hypothetical protein n=1 Tax=Vibrio parahaemolyticus TaxID=670 RepID=UPI0004138B2B|nr:hypothetical protein [Vibrio parahaemolyticus]EKY4874578.1 hypothetical protein [Vibrio alginolyticus]EGQ9884667.1 hypothetical protein [Vibrio parahaemolyticus]EGQ9889291.1 hypothetical protein [Vibrio parahaemolyticus]EGR3398825.1 hypothetical protein [Vibrio parahaemolyticus]EGR3401656.1 hypothetical protein [Vibrio parahaemolyticus]
MSAEQTMECSNNSQQPKPDYNDGNIRIKIWNNPERHDAHEIFTAMGCYVNAMEQFNKLVLQSVYPDSDFRYTFSSVENGSFSSVLSRIFVNVKDKFENLIDDGSDHELSDILIKNPEINDPKEVHLLAESIEERIADVFDIEGYSPYIDPVKLAEILKLISEGNENLEEGERVDVIINKDNVVPINTKFRSKVPVSKMAVTKVVPYRGPDEVKVIRPCNFGRYQWELKSKLTKDTYKAHFDKDCDWLNQYQNGEIPVVTARHTLKIKVEYDKHMTGKSYEIKNAIIKNVTVETDLVDGEQIQL